jgi:hypothetical protein
LKRHIAAKHGCLSAVTQSRKTTATTFAVAVIIIDFLLRQYPPVTKVQQIAIFQNGEFETAPRRQARMLVSGHTKS